MWRLNKNMQNELKYNIDIMITRFQITLILLIFSNCLYSQVDSIKSQILDYEDSKSTIISKGRKLLLDKFIEGDLMKVKEIKDYLINRILVCFILDKGLFRISGKYSKL